MSFADRLRSSIEGVAVICVASVACTAGVWEEPKREDTIGNSVNDIASPLPLDLYERLVPARVWGLPYVPSVSAAIVVADENVTVAHASKSVLHNVIYPIDKSLESLSLDEIRYILPLISSAGRHPDGLRYPFHPIIIIPTENAKLSVVRKLFDAGTIPSSAESSVIVAWTNANTRVAIAELWWSRSTDSRTYGFESEFYFKAWGAAHDIVIIDPSRAIECHCPRQGLGPCQMIEGSSKLTRVGLCGFDVWGDALSVLESRVTRVTEIVLFSDCSFLDSQLSGRGLGIEGANSGGDFL